jgi:hypothetical protein
MIHRYLAHGPIQLNFLFAPYILSSVCRVYYHLAALVFPIYNLMVRNCRHCLFALLNPLVMEPGPCQIESWQKNTSIYHTPLSLDCRIRDISYCSCSNTSLSCRTMTCIPLFVFCLLFLRAFWHLCLRALCSRNSWYFHPLHSLSQLYTYSRKSISICKSVEIPLYSSVLNDLAQRLLSGGRFYPEYQLTFPYFNFLAELKYEKPVDFNRVERAFLQP